MDDSISAFTRLETKLPRFERRQHTQRFAGEGYGLESADSHVRRGARCVLQQHTLAARATARSVGILLNSSANTQTMYSYVVSCKSAKTGVGWKIDLLSECTDVREPKRSWCCCHNASCTRTKHSWCWCRNASIRVYKRDWCQVFIQNKPASGERIALYCYTAERAHRRTRATCPR